MRLARASESGAARSLDLTVELWRAWFGIDMSDPLVFKVPVEQGLELMPAVCTDHMDAVGRRSRYFGGGDMTSRRFHTPEHTPEPTSSF